VLYFADEDADPRAAADELAAASGRMQVASRASPGRPPVVLIYLRLAPGSP
jgi:hypothetical protein